MPIGNDEVPEGCAHHRAYGFGKAVRFLTNASDSLYEGQVNCHNDDNVKQLARLVQRFDRFQQRHHFWGFSYAVLKKYGEDQAGYQAALLTYYGFVALFPLLLILTTVTALITGSHAHLQQSIITTVTNEFPVLGGQLSSHVQELHKSGLALIIGLLFTLYGARGVADAFRHAVNHIWQVPLRKRPGFPQSLYTSITMIITGGVGIVAAGLASGLAGAAGHGWPVRLLSALVNVLILYFVLQILLGLSLPKGTASRRDTSSGALAAAIGLAVLQLLGGYLLRRELRSLDALYSYFALALGLLFWIYLQAQVVCYGIEIAAVHTQRLWPRSLTNDHRTAVDEHREQPIPR